MSKNYWIISRPKRKLIIIPEMLKVFAAVAVGNAWSGNRDLQKEFEQELVNFEWKAQNYSQDGSGSRTYAALLGLLGLWYEDAGQVKLTQAGKEIVSGEPTVPQLTKQLINFQYPSPYSRSVGISDDFKIQPHRFVINLLSDGRIESITQAELAFCVVPFAKKNNDLDSTIGRILRYRSSDELEAAIRTEAMAQSETSADNLMNVANTVVNQLEYSGFFKYREELGAPLEFEEDGKDRAKSFIEEHGRGIASYLGDNIVYQTRYGSGINITKDYSRTNPVQPTTNPTDRLILIKYYEIAQKRPVLGISDDLVGEVAKLTGVSLRQVRNVLSKIANQPLLDNFEERYVNLAKGGTETATEFEKVTTNIFGRDGFGLDAEWVGSRGTYPDIFVYIDKESKIHGIIDTKAYKKYTLNIDQRNKMAHTYIPLFRELKHEELIYQCGFFAYIAGGFSPNIQSKFEILRGMTGDVDGAYITAYDLLQLLRKHRATPYSATELLGIFTMNKQIVYDDLPAL